MPRTSLAQIAGIIEIDPEIIPDDAAMLPYIESANELVTECCTGTKGPVAAYSDTRLEIIERWLAAHFYTQRDPRSTSESAGASISYQSSVAIGFDNSHYGQQAMRFDTNGGLATLNENIKKGKKRPSASWLGTKSETYY